MKITYSWAASSNVTFRGEDVYEDDDMTIEEWNAMSDKEREEFAYELVLSSCGFEWSFEVEEE